MSHRGAGFPIAYGPKPPQAVRKAVAKAEAQEAADSRRKAHSEQQQPNRQPVPEPANPPSSSKGSGKVDAARPTPPKVPADHFDSKLDPEAANVSNEAWLELLNGMVEQYANLLPLEALNKCEAYKGWGVRYTLEEMGSLIKCVHAFTAQALSLGELHWPMANRVLQMLEERKYFVDIVSPPQRKLYGYLLLDSTGPTGAEGHGGRGNFLNDSWAPAKPLWEQAVEDTVIWQKDGAKVWEMLEELRDIINRDFQGNPQNFRGYVHLVSSFNGMSYGNSKCGKRWGQGSKWLETLNELFALVRQMPPGSFSWDGPGSAALWYMEGFDVNADQLMELFRRNDHIIANPSWKQGDPNKDYWINGPHYGQPENVLCWRNAHRYSQMPLCTDAEAFAKNKGDYHFKRISSNMRIIGETYSANLCLARALSLLLDASRVVDNVVLGRPDFINPFGDFPSGFCCTLTPFRGASPRAASVVDSWTGDSVREDIVHIEQPKPAHTTAEILAEEAKDLAIDTAQALAEGQIKHFCGPYWTFETEGIIEAPDLLLDNEWKTAKFPFRPIAGDAFRTREHPLVDEPHAARPIFYSLAEDGTYAEAGKLEYNTVYEIEQVAIHGSDAGYALAAAFRFPGATPLSWVHLTLKGVPLCSLEPRRIPLQPTSVESSAPQGHQDPSLPEPDLAEPDPSVVASEAQSNYVEVHDSTFVRETVSSEELRNILKLLDTASSKESSDLDAARPRSRSSSPSAVSHVSLDEQELLDAADQAEPGEEDKESLESGQDKESVAKDSDAEEASEAQEVLDASLKRKSRQHSAAVLQLASAPPDKADITFKIAYKVTYGFNIADFPLPNPVIDMFGDLASQDLVAVVMPAHSIEGYAFYSKNASGILRHLAPKVEGLLVRDSKVRGICDLRHYIQFYVNQLIRHAPNVRGETNLDSKRLLAARLLKLDAVNILELMKGASSRVRFFLWWEKCTFANLNTLAQAPAWTPAWIDAMRSFPPLGISAITGHSFQAEDPLAAPLTMVFCDKLGITEIYHYTHASNVPNICRDDAEGGLHPGGHMENRAQVHFVTVKVSPNNREERDHVYPEQWPGQTEQGDPDIIHPYKIPGHLMACVVLDPRYCVMEGLRPSIHPGYQGTMAPYRKVPVQAIKRVEHRGTGRILHPGFLAQARNRVPLPPPPPAIKPAPGARLYVRLPPPSRSQEPTVWQYCTDPNCQARLPANTDTCYVCGRNFESNEIVQDVNAARLAILNGPLIDDRSRTDWRVWDTHKIGKLVTHWKAARQGKANHLGVLMCWYSPLQRMHYDLLYQQRLLEANPGFTFAEMEIWEDFILWHLQHTEKKRMDRYIKQFLCPHHEGFKGKGKGIQYGRLYTQGFPWAPEPWQVLAKRRSRPELQGKGAPQGPEAKGKGQGATPSQSFTAQAPPTAAQAMPPPPPPPSKASGSLASLVQTPGECDFAAFFDLQDRMREEEKNLKELAKLAAELGSASSGSGIVRDDQGRDVADAGPPRERKVKAAPKSLKQNKIARLDPEVRPASTFESQDTEVQQGEISSKPSYRSDDPSEWLASASQDQSLEQAETPASLTPRTRTRSPVGHEVQAARPRSPENLPSTFLAQPPVPPPQSPDEDHEDMLLKTIRQMRAEAEEGSVDAQMFDREIALREGRSSTDSPPQGQDQELTAPWRELRSTPGAGSRAPLPSKGTDKGKGKSKGKTKDQGVKGKDSNRDPTWWSSSWWDTDWYAGSWNDSRRQYSYSTSYGPSGRERWHF